MRFPGFLEPIAEKLRGRNRSMRQRFFFLPIEKMKLRLYYLTGRSWIDFYSERLDGFAALNSQEPPPEIYMEKGEEFLEFLIRYGLKPEHRVLDYGCGFLRAARYFIPYLNKGNYVGIEISENRVQKGHLALAAAGISRDAYEVHIVRDCLLKELGDQKFDVVWASSVLTHMPEPDIRALLGGLKSHLNADSVFYFTFSPSERIDMKKPSLEKIKNYYYPTPYLQEMFESCGYEFEVLPDGHAQKYQSPTVRATLARA